MNVDENAQLGTSSSLHAVIDRPRLDTALPERVLLVEDHRLLAQSLATSLQAEGVEADRAPLDSQAAIVASAREVTYDVILLDLDLGELGSTLPLIGPLRATGARVVVLTAVTDRERLAECVEAGAIGLVSKRNGVEELLASLREAKASDSLLGPGERDQLLAELRRQRKQREQRLAAFQRLTVREGEVLTALMNGKTATDIAAEWYVSITTVRTQIHSVLTKLGVCSQIAAIGLANSAGWSNR